MPKQNHQFHGTNPNIWDFSALSGAPFLEPCWALGGDLEKSYFFAIFSFCQIGFWGPKGAFLEATWFPASYFGLARRNAQAAGEGLGGGQ